MPAGGSAPWPSFARGPERSRSRLCARGLPGSLRRCSHARAPTTAWWPSTSHRPCSRPGGARHRAPRSSWPMRPRFLSRTESSQRSCAASECGTWPTSAPVLVKCGVSLVQAESSSRSSFFDRAAWRRAPFTEPTPASSCPRLGAGSQGIVAPTRYLANSMAGFLTRKEYEQALAEVGFVRVLGFDQTLGVASIVRGEVAK